MEFILLIFVNIIMGTIFYLIIRLRLEKTASDYREKKLKREIDEMTAEFNAAAERNISILENRISIMKKLIEHPGRMKTIDIQIDGFDGQKDIKIEEKMKPAGQKNAGKTGAYFLPEGEGVFSGNSAVTTELKKEKNTGFDLSVFLEMIIKLRNLIITRYDKYKDDLRAFYKEITAVSGSNIQTEQSPDYADFSLETEERISVLPERGLLIQADQTNIFKNPDKMKSEVEITLELSEREISDMFFKTEDKYSLISELHHRGYPANIITKCSGLPSGEVKLVLDLNGSV